MRGLDGLVKHLLGRAGLHQPSGLALVLDRDERGDIGHPGRLLHVVGDDHDRDAVLELADELLDAKGALGSSAEHGSSMSSTSGSTARARAMHSRCCWPPERPPAGALRRPFTSSQRPAPRSVFSTRLLRSSLSILRRMNRGPALMLSAIDLVGTGWGAGRPSPRHAGSRPDPPRGRRCRCRGGRPSPPYAPAAPAHASG